MTTVQKCEKEEHRNPTKLSFSIQLTLTSTGIQKDAQFIFLYLLQIRTDVMVFRNYILNIYDKSSQQRFYCTFSSFRIFCQALSLKLL